MTFFRRTRRIDPLDWRNHDSPESFAVALMAARVPTDEARRMLRAAVDENERLRQQRAVAYQQRRFEAELEERRREGAYMAAGKLLSEVGYRSEEW